jgi:hypothetical protein
MQFVIEIFYSYLVPVLAPNYKQHILSPAKVRKLCFSLAERYVRSVYENVFGWRGGGVGFRETLQGEASYKSLRSYGLYTSLGFQGREQIFSCVKLFLFGRCPLSKL